MQSLTTYILFSLLGLSLAKSVPSNSKQTFNDFLESRFATALEGQGKLETGLVALRKEETPENDDYELAVLDEALSLAAVHWDFDDCVKLSDAMLEGWKVTEKGFEMCWNNTKDLASIGWDILNCPQLNPLKAMSCYNDNFWLLKDTMTKIAYSIRPYLGEAQGAFWNFRVSFRACFGLPPLRQVKMITHSTSENKV